MSDNERARIAATTIWLPVPPTRSLVPPQHCASTPVSCGADQRQAGGAALTARPVVLLPRLPSLESPIVVQETLGGQPLDSTAVFPEREEEEVENACTTTATAATPSTARPLSDSTNLRLSDQPMAGKPSVDVHHASFATSISPIAKRSRTSRAPSESSAHSASGRRNSRSSNSNEASKLRANRPENEPRMVY
uniref:Shugoshin C-terminal domain-containing protein n=1 Tax=Mesocestoides corti TaxID=53468 RepID=A0A5K3FY96_MESCO